MAKATTDTVELNPAAYELSLPGEQSDQPQCEMCDFLFSGFKSCHSKAARADYGVAFIEHHMKMHWASART